MRGDLAVSSLVVQRLETDPLGIRPFFESTDRRGTAYVIWQTVPVFCIPPEETTGKAPTPVHPDFKAVQDIQLSDLPPGWRFQETLDVIGHVSQRVVMIYIPRMSSERPTSIFSECPHFGGTGFAYYVDRDIVKVRTNLHVIYNAEEASMATVQFSLHVPGKRHTRIIRLHATGHNFYHNLYEDYSSFTCVTTPRLDKYLHLFRDVPVMWDASFFQDDRESSSDTEEEAVEDTSVMKTDDHLPSNVNQSVMSSREDGHRHTKDKSFQNPPGETVVQETRRCETFIGEECRRSCLDTSDSTAEEGDWYEARGFADPDPGGKETSGCRSDFEEMDFTSDLDNSKFHNPMRCRRPSLEHGDYVAILSHPQGLKKSFSVGPAALYHPEALEKQRINFRNHRRLSWGHGETHAGHPAVHLINDRFKMCKNRIYHTESTFGCSGAPVLLFKSCLRRLKIPVVDYSQHSGTCFFKNGEKLGFATCFTPPVFSQSAREYEDLQQCYSVIRKQEQMFRNEEKRHSKRFETPDSGAESTHIVPRRAKYHYKMEKGTIVRRRILSANSAARVRIPYSSPLRSFVSANSRKSPAQLQTSGYTTIDDFESEILFSNKNDSMLRDQNNVAPSMSLPCTERGNASTCDASATLADFTMFSNLRNAEDECRTGSVSLNGNDEDKTFNMSQCSLNSSNLDHEVVHTLNGGSGYRINRKNSRKFACSLTKPVQEECAMEFHGLMTETKPSIEAWLSTLNENLTPATGHEGSSFHVSDNRETCQQGTSTHDADASQPQNSFRQETSESICSSDSSDKFPVDTSSLQNWNHASPFQVPHKDSDSCSEGSDGCNGIRTMHAVNGASVFTTPDGPDESEVPAVLKYGDERSLNAGSVDHIHGSHQDAICSADREDISEIRYTFKRTVMENSKDLYEPLSDSSQTKVNKLCNYQYHVDKTERDETVNVSEEREHSRGTSELVETGTETTFSVPDLRYESPASDQDSDEKMGGGNFATESSESWLVSETVLDYHTDSDSSDETFSTCSKISDYQQELESLETEILLTDDFMSSSKPLELTTSYSIADHPESERNNLFSHQSIVDRTGTVFSDSDQDMDKNGMHDQLCPVYSSAQQPVGASDHDPQFPLQMLTDKLRENTKQYRNPDGESEAEEEEKSHRASPEPVLEASFNECRPSEEEQWWEISLESELSQSETQQKAESESNCQRHADVRPFEESTCSSEGSSPREGSRLWQPVPDSLSCTVGVKPSDGTSTDQSLKADEEPCSDHFSHRRTSSSNNIELNGSNQEPLVQTQRSSEQNTKPELQRESDQSLPSQSDQRGSQKSVQEEKNMERELRALLPEIFRDDGKATSSRLTEINALNKDCSHGDPYVEQNLAHVSSEKLFDSHFQREEFEEKARNDTQDCRFVDKSRSASLNDSPMQLQHPRNRYSLNELKRLKSEWKKGCGDQQNEELWTAKDACTSEFASSLRDIIDRTSKTAITYFDSSQGQKHRYLQLNNIRNYLNEINRLLAPRSSESGKCNLARSVQHSSHRPIRQYDLGKVCGQKASVKEGVMTTCHSVKQRPDVRNKPDYACPPHIVYGKNTRATQENVRYSLPKERFLGTLDIQAREQYPDEACHLNNYIFDPVTGHIKSHQRQISEKPPSHTIQKSQPNTYLLSALSKASTDPSLSGMISKTGNGNDNPQCAHSSRLHVPVDTARNTTVLPSTQMKSQRQSYESCFSMYQPVPGFRFDESVFERSKVNSSFYLKNKEQPTIAPRRSSFWREPNGIAAINKNEFSQKYTNAERADTFQGSELSAATVDSLKFGAVGSAPIHRNMGFSQPTNMNHRMPEGHLNGANTGDAVPGTVDGRTSRHILIPGKTVNLEQRDRYRENHPTWAVTRTDPFSDEQYLSKSLESTHRPGSEVYSGQHQRGMHCSFSWPRIFTWQTRSDANSNPVPRSSYSVPDQLMMTPVINEPLPADCVHYQHESVKFDASLSSSPAVPSSTDSSSHSTPEISQGERESAAERKERRFSGAKVSETGKAWGSSRATDSLWPFMTSSGVCYNPETTESEVKCKGSLLTDACCKRETQSNFASFPTLKSEDKTKMTASSLSKAFDRFLSSDVDDDDGYTCTVDAMGCYRNIENQNRPEQRSADSPFSIQHHGEQVTGIGELLGICTEADRHRPSRARLEFSHCTGMAFNGAAHRSPVATRKADDSFEGSAYPDMGKDSKRAFSTSFDRLLDSGSQNGAEVRAAEWCHPLSRLSGAKSWKSPESPGHRGCNQKSHLYDLTDVVRVVLEMGVICPENSSQYEALVSSKHPLFDSHEDLSKRSAHLSYKSSSKGRDDCFLNSDGISKSSPESVDSCLSLKINRRSVSCRKELRVVNHPNQKYPQKQTQILNSSQDDVSEDCGILNNERHDFAASKSRQKNQVRGRYVIVSDPRGKPAGGLVLGSQPPGSSRRRVLCDDIGLPHKNSEGNVVIKKKRVLSHHSRHRQSCSHESEPFLPHVASHHPNAPSRFAGCDWQHTDDTHFCCPEVSNPSGWPWNDASYTYCSPLCSMHSLAQNPARGLYPPPLQPHQCLHDCLCRHLARCSDANLSRIVPPSSIRPDAHQCCLTDQHSSCQEPYDLLSRKLENYQTDVVEANNDDAWRQQACIPTFDTLDMSFLVTLNDLGIVQALRSDDGNVMSKKPNRPNLPREHCSSETTSTRGIYIKNKKSKGTTKANRCTRRGRDKTEERHLARQQSKHSGSAHESEEHTEPRKATSDKSSSSLEEREKDFLRTLESGQLSNDSGSEMSDREVCYVTVPVDIRVRLEKAAKWVSTQLFVCPDVHYLTPRDAQTFSIQENLRLTFQIMALND